MPPSNPIVFISSHLALTLHRGRRHPTAQSPHRRIITGRLGGDKRFFVPGCMLVPLSQGPALLVLARGGQVRQDYEEHGGCLRRQRINGGTSAHGSAEDERLVQMQDDRWRD
jgi:hypothetical protein